MTDNGNRSNENLVELHEVKKWFPVQQGLLDSVLSRGNIDHVRAVDGVSFNIKKGEVFGLAGESGSGKSTIGRLALRLLNVTEGTVRFDGVDLSTLNNEEMRRLRRRMQVIFQDPMASLSPRMRVGEAVSHPLVIHYPEEAGNKRQQAPPSDQRWTTSTGRHCPGLDHQTRAYCSRRADCHGRRVGTGPVTGPHGTAQERVQVDLSFHHP
jgi:ABC-type microcin C transport system duplicated ATPase subunit YejF